MLQNKVEHIWYSRLVGLPETFSGRGDDDNVNAALTVTKQDHALIRTGQTETGSLYIHQDRSN